MIQQLQSVIELAWENRASLSPANSPEIREAVEQVIADLNKGRVRVAERQGVGQWTVNQWVKKAVLLSFRLQDNQMMHAGDLAFFDKVKTKFAHMSEDDVRASGVRIVPPAVARRGSYPREERGPDAELRQHRRLCRRRHDGRHLGRRRLLRPDRQERAPVGRRRHRRGAGADAGQPDDHRRQLLHRGALGDRRRRDRRRELGHLDGRVHRPEHQIYDRATGEVTYGRVPAGSVVVAGSLPSADGAYSLYCAVIVKKVDAQTRSKTSINDLLRA
jgi:2,3,4,5-tetrahydropyridine-2-carboxylate N-succinyltransferase